MKKLAFVIAALAMALPAAAQQKQTRFGLGVSITPESDITPTIELYMPIDLGATLRIEPSLGIFTSDSDGLDTSDITLGAGVFLMRRPAQSVTMYYGGRLKLNLASADDGVEDDSGVDVTLAGALGGEYYLAPSFSLGLEGQLGFYTSSEVSGDASGFFTTGLGFLRLFF
ncbi:MAG TPA: hypothetical protein VEB43_14620 [Anaeromyxobacter sp.]|nr:hypothetical protein [Anaeromyxobacter sp.]